jgi:ABC-2 type transport system permease protein
MKLHRVVALLKVNTKLIVREPATLFIVILFPIMLTLLFGISFGAIGGDQQSTFQIGIVNLDESTGSGQWLQAFTSNLNATHILKLQTYSSNETAQADLVQGKIQAVLIIPEGFGYSCELYSKSPVDPNAWKTTTVALYLDSGSMIVTQAVPPVIQQALAAAVYRSPADTADPARPVQIGSPSIVQAAKFTSFDYMAPGLLAYAAIFLTMIVAQAFTVARERGLLKRINTTPTTASEFMASHIFSNMLLALLQVALVFAIAYAVGYRPLGNMLNLTLAFIIVSMFSLCCVGFGLITATVSKSSGAATGIAFLFILPQMMLGSFMPVSGNMQDVSKFLPSRYVTDALTSLFLRGAPITSPAILTDLAVVFIVSVLVLLAGVLLFKKYGNI